MKMRTALVRNSNGNLNDRICIKAKLIEYSTVWEHNKPVKYGWYEYRVHEYFVRFAGWNAASDESPALQHKREQEKVDNEIDNPDVPPTEEELIAIMKKQAETWETVWEMLEM